MQPLDEERQPVSSPMMTDLVLQSPKDRERRNRQQQMTSRPQHAADFVQRREIVLDMFDDVRRQDEIELAIGERQRRRRPAEPLRGPFRSKTGSPRR